MENEVFIFSYKFFYKVILILSIKCSFNFLKKKIFMKIFIVVSFFEKIIYILWWFVFFVDWCRNGDYWWDIIGWMVC